MRHDEPASYDASRASGHVLGITRLSVAKPLAVIAIFVAIAVGGLLAYSGLPINLLPTVNIPVVTIVTIYPGAGPLEVESHVTQVIEDSVASLSNLDVMTSTSTEGASTIALTFTDKANADLIATTVECQVNAVLQNLPADAQRPSVTKIDLSALPIMKLAVVSDTLPGTRSQARGKRTFRPTRRDASPDDTPAWRSIEAVLMSGCLR